ncbi:uncharacterized protein LOC116659613 isoform X2 [Camelus ferus]|uniref:Uncharacterized protein LOC116659613 isoform X2 n=1 Tax=Camelus ferus TaxID=419612 RepID=A0A8B8RZA5_CAMFR|nr:uncharacterized protein LOC116659613 isoform X2 [Camelus ferus]
MLPVLFGLEGELMTALHQWFRVFLVLRIRDNRGRGSAPGACGRWAGAGCSWTGSRRRNAAWGLGDRLLSLLLPSPSRNPRPELPLCGLAEAGAGMETWTSEPAQSSGSWVRAWFSWTSYPRRNAAWGLGCHFLSPLLPSLVRVIPGDPLSATSPMPGFWWGWPAGAWTADIPSTAASSPMSPTSLTGWMRSRGSHRSLMPCLRLLRPSFHTSLCKLLARRGLAQALCPHSLGPCCCFCSRPHVRPCGDLPSPSAPSLCLRPQSPCWNFPPLPSPSPISFQRFLLGFPVQQLPLPNQA